MPDEIDLQLVLGADGVMDKCYKHLANGGSLLDLADAWKIRYSDLMHWIHGDLGRKQMYEDGLQAQSEWAVRKVLQEVKRIGFADIRDAYGDDNQLKEMSEMPAEVAACLQSVESVDYFEGTGKDRAKVGVIRKVKFWNKLEAAKMLMQNLGMLIERVEHSGKVSLEALIQGSIELEKSETITIEGDVKSEDSKPIESEDI